MLASLNVKGRMGVVLDNGVLFRGRTEHEIRKKIVEADLVEAVIALPSNLFYNTVSPGCILVLNKRKPTKRQNKVIFVYAVKECSERNGQNMFEEAHISRIKQATMRFKNVDRFSRVVGLEEIGRNNFNLNVPRYVDTIELEEKIPVERAWAQLRTAIDQKRKLTESLERYLEELDYGSP